MAYIRQRSVKSEHHIANALDYNANPMKALQIRSDQEVTDLQAAADDIIQYGTHSTYLNCSAIGTAQEFANVRMLHNQNKGVLAHQYTQAFSPEDDITPQQAHLLGVELARKMFPTFQVSVSTHIDKHHIHNHILVNSCDMVTGRKWLSNKTTLKNIQDESDRICIREGLHIIEKQSAHSGVDAATTAMMEKGKSWKTDLLNTLDKAIEHCHSKDAFVTFLESNGFHVERYTATSISVRKEGEKKSIRLDTLAKQFGSKYSKTNLEEAMGFTVDKNSFVQEAVPPRKKCLKPRVQTKSLWEQLTEYRYAESRGLQQRNLLYGSIERMSLRIPQVLPERFFIRGRFSLLLLFLQLITGDHRYPTRIIPAQRTYQFSVRQLPPRNFEKHLKKKVVYGTMDYKTMMESSGDTFTCDIPAYQVLTLQANPLLFHSQIHSNGTAGITIKETDKERFLRMLSMNDAQRKEAEATNAQRSNARLYRKLKQKAQQLGISLSYMVVTQEQAEQLRAAKQEVVFFQKGDNVNIAFLPQRADQIKSIIKPAKRESQAERNRRIYAELKRNAETSPIVYANQVSLDMIRRLEAAGFTFAYFPCSNVSDRYNLAYSQQEQDAIREAMSRYRDTDNDGVPDYIDSSPTTHNNRRNT